MKRHLVRLGQVSPLAVIASIVGLGAFALGQPLLDLLGRNPEFFIARRFPALDLAILVLLLLLIPVVLALPVLALRWVSPAVAGGAHLLVLTSVGAVAAATIFSSLGLDGWSASRYVALAVWCGVVLAYMYAGFGPVRTGFTFLGLAPLAFGLWFAFATPASQILLESAADLPEAVDAANPVPVVMVVYDEFPLATMVRPDGSLDDAHFPNFGRLASDGTWYRNAVGVRQQTEEALPAILTGRAVSQGSIPTTADHPFSLFTLLSGDYDVAAVENVTELCPPFICSNVSRPVDPVADRWAGVFSDLSVVYGHIVLPESMAADLPPVDEGWGGFGEGSAEKFDIIERFNTRVSDDRRLELDRFVETLDGMGDTPSFRFAHFLYPHHPWNLTADGRIYGAPRSPGRDGAGWGPDPYLVAQGWQRHMIQSHYADTMLGEILDTLEAEGVYNDALIVVVADHGITVEPNTTHQRRVTPETVGNIAYVPLFVKYPAGADGAPAPGSIDDVRAETVDIAPTVAEIVEAPLPWSVDGISLLDIQGREERPDSIMVGPQGRAVVPPGIGPMLDVVDDQEGWFPGGDPYRLVPGGWDGLLGREGIAGEDVEDLQLVIDQADDIVAYVPGTDPVPAYLSGSLANEGGVTGEEVVAIEVDGTIRAVTRTYASGDAALWESMLEPALLDEGIEEIRAWLVTGSPDEPEFTG